MTSPTRLAGVIENLFHELADCRGWQADLAAETARARHRQHKLVASLRAVIKTLTPDERPPHLARLGALCDLVPPAGKSYARPTTRTRFVLAWLAAREPADFHIAELRADCATAGHGAGRSYLPTLLMRFKRRGIIEAAGYGRYKVCREHPELVG